MQKTSLTTFLNPRLLATLLLGFSSGLPFTLTASTLQAWYTEANASFAMIGVLTLLGTPYILKFIWSPFLDYYQPLKLGLRKGWIILMQVGVAALLYVLANMNPTLEPKSMCVIAFCIAFFAATQDMAIDAYRTDILQDQERGLGAAYYVFTYRLATLASGGLALVFADRYGFKLTYEIMAAMMLLLSFITLRTPVIHHATTSVKSVRQTLIVAFRDLRQRENLLILLTFVFLYKIGDALALTLMTKFLLHGLGFTLTEVGLAYKIVSFVATILGAFIGGVILTRKSIFYGLVMFGFAQAFSNLMFVVLAASDKSFSLMATAIFIENFCSGLSTAAFFAFLMSLCNKKYTASQYALLSAVASLGRVFLGPVAAMIVTSFGWTQFFVWSFILSFPGVILLLLWKKEVMGYEHPVQESI